jgi:predicted molibdopterin-dependent oxidoreductase YjgC
VEKTRVTITIDGRQIEVEPGARLLDVAEANDIYIPHLCYYPNLSIYGGCRMCVVEIEGARGQPMACTTYVAEGMEVTTQSEALTELRRQAMALMQSDHPGRCFDCHRIVHCPPGYTCLRDYDVTERCLTCAKNKNCELQDTTEWINLRQCNVYYKEKLSWYGDREWIPIERDNPFIERDYNKCILCTRCVRVCEEVRGRAVYALTYRAGRAQIDTCDGLPLHETNCEFCGACIDVCPTASLMDRKSKWEGIAERRVKTTCPYCGVGCSMFLEIKGEKIIRVTPDAEGPANMGQLCVKGRFGLEFVQDERRLTTPLIKRDGKFVEADWDEALDLVAEKFAQYKGDQFAVVSSAKCTNEENYVVQKFARGAMGTNNVDHCARL